MGLKQNFVQLAGSDSSINFTIRADSFNTKLIESVPFKYVHGSSHEGTNHGYLDKNEVYELYSYYTFKTKEDIEEFLAKSDVSVQWKEKGENKQILLKLPSKPTE